MADSNPFLSPKELFSIAQENKYCGILKGVFLFYAANGYCVYTLKSSRPDDSNEYTVVNHYF